MKFSFNLNKELSSTLEKVGHDIRNNGGKFSGNDKSGTFEGKGIKGSYSVNSTMITIAITQKPPLIKDDKIKEEIINYFGGNNGNKK